MPVKTMVRILLADDHTVMRAGLRLLLERHEDFEVVGEASDGRQAVDIATELKPAVVVMDIAMPQLNGVEAARQILSRDPETAIVMLSMHSDESYVLRSSKPAPAPTCSKIPPKPTWSPPSKPSSTANPSSAPASARC